MVKKKSPGGHRLTAFRVEGGPVYFQTLEGLFEKIEEILGGNHGDLKAQGRRINGESSQKR